MRGDQWSLICECVCVCGGGREGGGGAVGDVYHSNKAQQAPHIPLFLLHTSPCLGMHPSTRKLQSLWR